MGLGGHGVASGRLGAGRRGLWGAGKGLLMALLPAICVQEVLGLAFSCHIRGAGPGSLGVPVAARIRRLSWLASSLGLFPGRWAPVAPEGGLGGGGGRRHRPRRLWMHHLLRSAHGIGYEALDVILGEGGAVHARGGSPSGRRVVPLLARGVPLCVHGEVPDDTAVDTVDCRRQAAGRGRYPTQGSADHCTRRMRLCVRAEGQVPKVFSSIKGLRDPLRPIQSAR